MEQITLNVRNETAPLKAVILGIGTDQGEPYDINPVAKMHKEQGSYPTEEDIIEEIDQAKQVLEKAGVKVYRPQNLPEKKQIFTRDIGFVIDNTFVIANMKEPIRKHEIKGIAHLLEHIPSDQIVEVPESATIEGGDIILHGDHVFVGISDRTNIQGYEFLKSQFPQKQVHAIPLKVTKDPKTNILHLDCAFQPVGNQYAIYYEEGFESQPEAIHQCFEEDQLIRVSQPEMNQMFPNIFSISPNHVIIEKGFTRLIEELEKRDIQCSTVPYSETSKLSGLLRCSTLPLQRT